MVIIERGMTLLFYCSACRLLLIKLNNCGGFTLRPGLLVLDQANVANLPIGFKEVMKFSLGHVDRKVSDVNRRFIL